MAKVETGERSCSGVLVDARWVLTGKDGRSADKLRNILKIAEALANGCRRTSSFVAGTRVLLAGGQSRAIQDLGTGDRVVAADPIGGGTGARAVTATITSAGAKRLVEVTVDADGSAGDKTATLSATDGHRFWVPQLKSWVPARALEPGLWLSGAAGVLVEILAVYRHTEAIRVHNLTVAGYHSYYVLAGDTPVLVHNDGWTVPDDYVIVLGGQKPMPDAGVEFSGSMGTSVEDAASAVPHNQVRVTTAGEIRAAGGTVDYAPEPGLGGAMNYKHVDVTLGDANPFSDPVPNPVPKANRMTGSAFGLPRC
ncbi:Hint domain-containing protein [Phytohabitans suffuscus]|uniref:Hint domain-containing protein n=1 Tax=Phytohabitans suffuscus TaxID=624315 RepID=UPI00156497F9|nr:Hint domain-containing protein [Phytohabitans suffuscus]